MLKIIRTKTILIVIIIIGILFSLKYFVIQPYAKKEIISAAEQAFEAKAELGTLDIKFLQGKLSLKNLNIANKEKPMTNIISISDISADLSLLKLMEKKVLIEEMIVNGIKFDTKRKKSGELIKTQKEQKQVKDTKNKNNKTVSLKPDMPEINADNIVVVNDINNLKKDINNAPDKIDKLLKEFNYQAKLDELNKDISEVSNTKIRSASDLLGLAKSISNTSKKYKKYEKEYKDLENKLNLFSEDLTNKYNNISKQSDKELNSLLAGISGGKMSSISLVEQVFGTKATKYLSYIETAMAKVSKLKKSDKNNNKRISKKSKGRYIEFNHPSVPAFLIKKIKISGTDKLGNNFIGKITEISNDLTIRKIPTELLINSTNKIQPYTIKGTLTPAYDFDLKINSTAKLAEKYWNQTEIPLAIKKGLYNLSAEFKQTSNFIAEIKITTEAAIFNSLDKDKIYTSVANSLSKQSNLKINVKYKNGHPIIASNIDAVISDSINSLISEEINSTKKQLKKEWDSKVTSQLNSIKKDISGVDSQYKKYLEEFKKQLNIFKKK